MYLHLLVHVFLAISSSVSKAYYHDYDRSHLTTCGSELTDGQGVIATPNFPNPFPVPIKCRWILHNSKVNGTTSVYFTQQYTTVGLSFTEYLYYDDSFKTGGRTALVVTDENITRIKWLQVTSPYLVIELDLNHIEGTQFRALGLLNIFGFNITYQMRPDSSQTSLESRACSVIECRLLGHCYAKADFQDFFCACFPGYSGDDCGIGPLCPKTLKTCQNGGICRQMGPAAVSCLCRPGYTGDFCETDIAPPECGIEECDLGCKGNACDCYPKDNDVQSARYETVLHVVEEPTKNISVNIVGQITTYLKNANITLEDDIQLLNISKTESTIPAVGKSTWKVTLRIWSPRKEAGNLRTVLARLAVRGKIGPFKLIAAPLHFDMYPALALQALSANQKTEVWEGAEFILTCMAYGSSATSFIWYKDGVRINFNATTRDIWTRTVAEDALGRRMSVLGIGYASKPDSGVWSCVATDAGRERCRAIRMSILHPPNVKLTPTTITVNKEDNVSITCLASASGRIHGALGFSWSRGGSLLPLAPGRVMWEDLYPAGSVLRLFNVQKSNSYRCQVSTAAGRRGGQTDVWVATGPTCPTSPYAGVRWPRAAPTTKASAECPHGLIGEATRYCELKPDTEEVEWQLPDFSDCLAESLSKIFEEFTYLSYGYSNKRPSSIASQYAGVLRSQPSLPGIGTKPLSQAKQMLKYIESTVSSSKERLASVMPFMKIYDHLLVHPDSFLDEQNIFDLQSSISTAASFNPHFYLNADQFTIKSHAIDEDVPGKIVFNVTNATSKPWVFVGVEVELFEKPRFTNVSVIAVHFTSLEKNLPSLRKTSQMTKETEVEYELVSHHVQVSLSATITDPSGVQMPPTVILYYQHINNYSDEVSRFACGHRLVSDPSAWNIRTCDVKVHPDGRVVCACRGVGSFGLLKVARSLAWEGWSGWLSAARYSCLLLAACSCLSAIAAISAARAPRSPAALLLPRAVAAITAPLGAASLSHAAEVSEVDWHVMWQWIGAGCWLMCCAALAAQPLLLQAELVGRTQAIIPIVAVLTGVCLLSLLSAGVANAKAVWARAGVGSLLLALLAASLALLAALRLRALARKTQSDRRFYIRSRMRIVQHTFIMLICCGVLQIASYMYAVPEPTNAAAVLYTSSCLATSLAVIICYILRDTDVMIALRNVATFNCNVAEWDRGSDYVNASLNLYVKHTGESEVRSASGTSAVQSYWRAPTLESPAHLQQRRQSVPDSRADIVRCVEFKDVTPIESSPEHFPPSKPITPSRSLCDLIPGEDSQEYSICVPLNVKNQYNQLEFHTYDKNIDVSKENCHLCAKSNPDLSKVSPPAKKSCLKKTCYDLNSSMPSIGSGDRLTDLNKVNKEWNKKYGEEGENADRVLHKISDDLDFLLNRTSETAINVFARVNDDAE